MTLSNQSHLPISVPSGCSPSFPGFAAEYPHGAGMGLFSQAHDTVARYLWLRSWWDDAPEYPLEALIVTLVLAGVDHPDDIAHIIEDIGGYRSSVSAETLIEESRHKNGSGYWSFTPAGRLRVNARAYQAIRDERLVPIA